MASGKNFFCSVLEENGFVSIDADKCVHSIISDKTETILKEFLPVAESLNKTEFKNSPLKIQKRRRKPQQKGTWTTFIQRQKIS